MLITYVKINNISSSGSQSTNGVTGIFSIFLIIPFTFFIIVEIILLFIVLSGSGKKAEIKDNN
jgi:hypothetical protein